MELSFTRALAHQRAMEDQAAQEGLRDAPLSEGGGADAPEAEPLERALNRMSGAFARLMDQTGGMPVRGGLTGMQDPDRHADTRPMAEMQGPVLRVKEMQGPVWRGADWPTWDEIAAVGQGGAETAVPPGVGPGRADVWPAVPLVQGTSAHLARLAFSVGLGLADHGAAVAEGGDEARIRAYADILGRAGSRRVSLEMADEGSDAAGASVGLVWGSKGAPDTVTLEAGTDAVLWIAPEVESFRLSLKGESMTVDFGQGKVRFQGVAGAGSISLCHGAVAA